MYLSKVLMVLGIVGLVLAIISIKLTVLLPVAVLVVALGLTLTGFLFLRMLRALTAFVPKK